MKKLTLLYFRILNFDEENIQLLKKNFNLLICDSPNKISSHHYESANIVFAPLGFYFSKDVINNFRSLKTIASNTTGDSHIDSLYAKSKNINIISLKNDQDFLTSITPTAEFTWALILSLTRNLIEANKSVINGEWNRFKHGGNKMLSRSTIGLVGMGRLGFMVAKHALKFGMQVIYYDPKVDCGFPLVKKITSLKALVSKSDIISVHIPNDKKNKHLFNGEIFKYFKKNSFFINTSRGEIVDHKCLLDALNRKIIAGAALDVFENEFNNNFASFLKHHPLIKYAKKNSNLLITPHIAGSTIDAWRETQRHTINKILILKDNTHIKNINYLKGNIWAFIPARGGSKSIPLKNLAKLNGKLLIDYSIDVAMNTKQINNIFCSSENSIILNHCLSKGINIVKRTKKLSADHISTVDVISDFLSKQFLHNNYLPELIVLLEPTSPFVKSLDIKKCINFLNKNKDYDSAQTVTKVSSNSHAYNQRYHISNCSKFLFEDERQFRVNKQAKPNLFIHGNLRVFRTSSFIKYGSIFGKKSYPIIISKIAAMDVDDKDDLKIASAILKSNCK